MTGIHGIGDPPAAATVGLAEVVHIPKELYLEKEYCRARFQQETCRGHTINRAKRSRYCTT